MFFIMCYFVPIKAAGEKRTHQQLNGSSSSEPPQQRQRRSASNNSSQVGQVQPIPDVWVDAIIQQLRVGKCVEDIPNSVQQYAPNLRIGTLQLCNNYVKQLVQMVQIPQNVEVLRRHDEIFNVLQGFFKSGNDDIIQNSLFILVKLTSNHEDSSVKHINPEKIIEILNVSSNVYTVKHALYVLGNITEKNPSNRTKIGNTPNAISTIITLLQ